MNGFEMKNILGCETPAAIAGDPSDALICEYCPYETMIQKALAEFREDQRAFFALTLKDEKELIKAAKKWERSSVILAGYAASLFRLEDADDVQRKFALELMDMTSKAAMLRLQNLAALQDKARDEEPVNETRVEKLTKVKQDADCCLMRMVNTQDRYRKAYKNGEKYVSAQHDKEAEAAARAEEERALIPPNCIHLPGKIYPPIPIPEGERLPEPPLAYQLEKMQPTSAKVYDPELDELVLKPGYVSPDGLIDDKSVIRDRKNHRVIMKLRGETEPVIWSEWKPKDTRDIITPDSWVWQYHVRLSIQLAEDERMTLFSRRPYEDEGLWTFPLTG